MTVRSCKGVRGAWEEGKGSACDVSAPLLLIIHTFCLDNTLHLAAAEKQNPRFNEPIKCLQQQGFGEGPDFALS